MQIEGSSKKNMYKRGTEVTERNKIMTVVGLDVLGCLLHVLCSESS